MKQPHEILGVAKDASIDAIHHAYLQRATTVHPDAGGSKEEFVALRDAYEGMVEFIETGALPIDHTDPPPNYSYATRSHNDANELFEELKRQVQAELDRDFNQQPAPAIGSSRSTIEYAVTIALTVFFALALTIGLCYDGQRIDLAVSSFGFSISLVFLIYLGGTISVLGASLKTDYLTIYRRAIIVFSLLPLLHAASIAMTWFGAKSDSTPTEAVIKPEHLPSWWPIQAKKREQ